jgi:hypothetical protein
MGLHFMAKTCSSPMLPALLSAIELLKEAVLGAPRCLRLNGIAAICLQ